MKPSVRAARLQGARAFFSRIVSSVPDFGNHWADREARAGAARLLNFGCDFQDGLCRFERYLRKLHKDQVAIIGWRTGCCCEGCAIGLSIYRYHQGPGWLKVLPSHAVSEVSRLYEPRWGFWRRGIGCILPWRWRSLTCLGKWCYQNEPELDPGGVYMEYSEKRKLWALLGEKGSEIYLMSEKSRARLCDELVQISKQGVRRA